MRVRILLAAVVAAVVSVTAASAAERYFEVAPASYDPAHTFLVQATWVSGIGCPTGAHTFNGSTTSPYTDPACPAGDPRDSRNEGLLLAKTGPTSNYAAAQARIVNPPPTVTELGYDIRKPLTTVEPSGSHCGAGAPRFDIVAQEGTYFIGCNSPPGVPTSASQGWIRLRWGASTMPFPQRLGQPALPLSQLHVKSISIVFDEGQDTGPDFFGMAVLDNIDVNEVLVGKGPRSNDHQG